MTNDHTDLSFRNMNWSYYMKPYFSDEIHISVQNHIQNLESQRNNQHCGLTILIANLFKTQNNQIVPFKKDNIVKEMEQLKISLHDKVYDPLICIYIAEYHQQLKNDFQDVWYYQILSSLFLPIYHQNSSYCIESLQKLRNIADNDLQNSISILENRLSPSLNYLKEILIEYLKFQLESDLLLKLKFFKNIKLLLSNNLQNNHENNTQLISFELLFEISLQYRYDQQIIKTLKQSFQAQKIYINKKKIELEIIYSNLTEDHELYQNFRKQIFEFFKLRQICLNDVSSSKQQRVIENEINILTMKILRLILESSKQFLQKSEIKIIIISLSQLISYLSRSDSQNQKVIKDQKNLQLFNISKLYDSQDNYCVELDFILRKIQMQQKLQISNDEQTQELIRVESLADKNITNQQDYIERFLKCFYQCKIMKCQAKHYNCLELTQTQRFNLLNQSQIQVNQSQIQLTQNQFATFNDPLFLENEFDKSFFSMLSPISHKVSQDISKVSRSYLNHVNIFARRMLQIYDIYQREFEESGSFEFLVKQLKIQKYIDQDLDFGYLHQETNQFESINSVLSQKLRSPFPFENLKFPSSGIQQKIWQVQSDQVQKNKILKKGEISSTSYGTLTLENVIYNCVIKEQYRENQDENQNKTYQNWEGVEGLVPILAMSKSYSEITLLTPIMQKDLIQYQRNGRLSLFTIMCILSELCKTLSQIHSKQLIHGNLKESNIFQDNKKFFLSDFSIYRSPDQDETSDANNLAIIINNMLFKNLTESKPNQQQEIKKLLEQMVQKGTKLDQISNLIESYI